MKHLKHLCHSNKKSYLSCWQNQTMKKRILQLTGARREYLYTHIKSHWKTPLTPTQFPESHQAQTFPIGSLKVQFSHRNICQYWRNIIWCSVHTHLHSHHMSPKQVISQSFIGVLAKIPSRIMSFSGNSAEKQKAKNQIYINHSDLTDRTGHWIENQCLKYLKKVLCFQTEWDRQRKSAYISLCWCA